VRKRQTNREITTIVRKLPFSWSVWSGFWSAPVHCLHPPCCIPLSSWPLTEII